MEEKLGFLESLRTFVNIRGTGNLEEAAKALGVHKNTVRSHLSRLSEQLGVDLIAAGVKRTEAGLRIDTEAGRLLDELEASLDAARIHLRRVAAAKFPVQLAMSSTIWMWGAEDELSPLTHSLSARNAIEFLVANSERVERAVADGWFELGVTARNPNGQVNRKLTSQRFCTDEIVLALPPGHEWAKRRKLNLEDLAQIPLITLDSTSNARRIVDNAMEEKGLQMSEPHGEVAMAVMAFEETLSSGVPALISGLAFESPQGRAAVEAGVRRRSIDGADLSREFLLVHANRLRDEAREVRDVLADLSIT